MLHSAYFSPFTWGARGDPKVAIDRLGSVLGIEEGMQGLGGVALPKSDLCTHFRNSLVIFVENEAYFRALLRVYFAHFTHFSRWLGVAP